MKTPTAPLVALLVLVAPATVRAAPPTETPDDILCRTYAAVDFSYWWGGECWCRDGCDPGLTSCSPGTCTINPGGSGCPDCTHSGPYGADCSGLVSKAWQVPDPQPVEACHVDRYVAANFTADHAYWDPVPMSSLQPADAAATSHHVVMIVGGRDDAGNWDIIEARGCSYGIVHRYRSLSGYVGARRINLTSCVCSAGETQTEDCGDCGTRRRDCSDGCRWSAWSDCDGPDPTGADAVCTVDGALGECAVGRRMCVAGWLTCHAPLATTEVCDGLDNDCDGVTDNGTPASLGEGFPCTTDGGAPGLSTCIDGALVCLPAGTPDGGPTDVGIPDDGGPGVTYDYVQDDGCGCGVPSTLSPLPVLPFLALLGLLARRRRR